MPTPFSVTGTESFLDGVRLGFGLAQMPVFHIERDLAEGRIERVPQEYPVPSAPVSVLYPRNASSHRVCCSLTGSCSGFRSGDRAAAHDALDHRAAFDDLAIK
jgi:DNA-binding transcriptional LysR family regulator